MPGYDNNTMNTAELIGVGCHKPKIVLHIANRPPTDVFELDGQVLDINRPLALGEAAAIIQQTGNHWRKVFSILAKISFALFDTGCQTWQEYRDTVLLTDQGFEYLSFSPLTCSSLKALSATPKSAELINNNNVSVNIICGFNYAQTQLDFDALISHQRFEKLKWSEQDNCLVTPYFDWRQLNNEMLGVVITILSSKLSINGFTR